MAASLSPFLYLVITVFFLLIFFADPLPRPWPQEEEITHLGIYNMLLEEKRDYKALVTTIKLQKYVFDPSGTTLPKSSNKKRVIFY